MFKNLSSATYAVKALGHKCKPHKCYLVAASPANAKLFGIDFAKSKVYLFKFILGLI